MGLSDIDEDDIPPVIIPTLPPPNLKPKTPPPVVTPTAPSVVIPAAPSVVKTTTPSVVTPTAPSVITPTAPTNAPAKKDAFDFDDLFGDQATVPTATPPVTAPLSGGSDPLDSLFASPPVAAESPKEPTPPTNNSNGIYVGSSNSTANDDDLIDFSKPTEVKKYTNAEGLLDAFENMGKKTNRSKYAENSLESLTRNKDDNKVKARLLALMNYYDVLGVSQSASEDEIRRAYKRKALQLHPDRVGRDQTPEEAELFKMITKANETLTDDALRRAYDASLLNETGVGAQSDLNNFWGYAALSAVFIRMFRRSNVFLSSWRDQGISYVKYLNVSTEALHMAVKPRSAAKYSRFSTPNYVSLKPDGSGGMAEVKTVPAFTKDY